MEGSTAQASPLASTVSVSYTHLRAEEEVRAALAKCRHGVVRMRRFAPWKQYLIPSKAKFVVFPSQRGG